MITEVRLEHLLEIRITGQSVRRSGGNIMTAPPLRTGLSRSPGQMLLSTSPGEVGLGGSPSGQSSSCE